MIYESMQILKEELENYFSKTGLGKIIILENIGLWESGSESSSRVQGKVVVSLLRIEEEATLKNTSHYTITENRTDYKNPPVHLNLYLLISANCETYDKSLYSISKILEYFQGKKVFTSANTIFNRENPEMRVADDFRFIVELFTPSFEEMNNIWGTFGGRQMPSVIFKVQLIKIERDKKLASADAIIHIGGKINHLKQ